MDNIINILLAISDIIWSKYVLIPLLLGTGLYFTIRTRALQIRLLPQMVKSIVEKPEQMGEKDISPFQAFAVGLASRVGTGNLAGVAIAISLGGAGAVFWMWIVAILGSVSAFVESTLAQLYKVRDEEVEFRGGPAYYMQNGLKSRKMGIAFSILISLCFGLIFNSVQANTISQAFSKTLNFNGPRFPFILGFLLVLITGYILFGGSKRIANFSSVIVPIMATLYLILAIIVIILRIDQIPTVFNMIITDAFSFNSAIGGGIGITIIQGVKRGLFSNEAGMGSAPNAAASATTNHPVKQGLIQSFGVYIDTLIVCSATAFIILSSGIETTGASDGIALTMDALSSVLGNWSLDFLTIAIFFFGFSSILGNYYYAQSNIEFIKNDAKYVQLFKCLVLAMVFWGAIASSETVWAMADLFMGLMAILNIIAILLLGKQALICLKDYEEQLRAGKDPEFDAGKYPELNSLEIWTK